MKKPNFRIRLCSKKDTAKVKIKHDSVYMTADTLETRIVTYKDSEGYTGKNTAYHISLILQKKPPSIVYKTSPKFIEISPQNGYRILLTCTGTYLKTINRKRLKRR